MVPRLHMSLYPQAVSVDLLRGDGALDAGAKCLISQSWDALCRNACPYLWRGLVCCVALFSREIKVSPGRFKCVCPLCSNFKFLSMSCCSFLLFIVLFLCFSVVDLGHGATQHLSACQWNSANYTCNAVLLLTLSICNSCLDLV